jgi:hypothetical protein
MEDTLSKFLIHILLLSTLILFSCSINNTTEYYYTVTIKSGSHGTVCNAGDHLCSPQNALKIQVCSVEDGYKFKEWILDSMVSTPSCVISDRFKDTATITQVRGRMVVYPEFTQNAFTLSIFSDTLGNVALAQIRTIVAGKKTRITAIALPKDTIGYRFSHWVITSGNGEIFGDSIVMEGDCSIKPVFERNNYLLTVAESSNGRILDSAGGVMSGTYSFPYGYVVKLNSSADTGYQFSSWSGASGTAVMSITMDGNKNVGANYISIPGTSGIIYVWKGASGNGTGANWVNAYTDLQTALTNAADGATIWVARGVFSPIDASTPFIPKTSTFLYGGFNGFETTLSQRVFNEHFTELSGLTNNTIVRLTTSGITVNGFVFSNASGYGVVVTTAAINSTIEDCVFKNISTTAVSIQSGATVANRNAIIRRCVFHSNNGTTAAGKGISIANLARWTLIENCVFTNNTGSGPAITDLNNSRDSDSITNIICCTVINNSNTSTTPGGIRSVGNMRLRGCIIYGNTNQNGGLGMQVDSTWIVEDCDIQSHSTTAGILRKDAAGFAGNNNMDINPLFTYDGTPLADGAWFLQSSNHPLLSGLEALRTADFISNKPSVDIRKRVRGTTFDFGAYQH